MEERLFTAGELAKMAGVSLRTIRFYDIKGLLCPVAHSQSGYRLYDLNSFATLQHILMLKYLGFSLEQIAELLQNEGDMQEHLSQQMNLLTEKKVQLEQMIATIRMVQASSGEAQWDALLHLLNLMTDDEKIIEQYRSSENLDRRINLHAYSTSEENWYDWVYERLQMKEGQRVLEIGCGNAMLWAHNAHKLPENLDVTLTDRSDTMLSEAKKVLQSFDELFTSRNIRIRYQVADANQLILPSKAYDLVMANHMLYHVTNREACFSAIADAMKADGLFCCTTIGTDHMKELYEIVDGFDSEIAIQIPAKKLTESFKLENGREQLIKYFSDVQMEVQDNDLLVDDVRAIYNYVYSFPGNAPYVLKARETEFHKMLQERMDKEGAIYIHKAAGMFRCRAK